VSRNAVRASADAARKARAEEGRRAWEAQQRARERDEHDAKHDPFKAQVPDHSVVHRYARCTSYPEWGVGSVTGIYFTGDGDNVQQWARVKFQPGIRTVPAGSLQFVDFSKPDDAADRVERFVTAAQHAVADGDHALAAQRLVYARNADPGNPTVLRLLTLAFWQAGDLRAAGRAVRDWARHEGERPAPHRFASRIYEDMGAIDLAAEAADREAARGPRDASAWERVGRLRLRLMDRPAALAALERARTMGPSLQGLLDLALVHQLMGDVGAEVSACAQATELEPASAEAWSRYAHALARTDRPGECLTACERALQLGADPEVRDLRDRVRAAQPRELAGRAAA
jgi:tetratricopeptide (TPR) repeat protein